MRGTRNSCANTWRQALHWRRPECPRLLPGTGSRQGRHTPARGRPIRRRRGNRRKSCRQASCLRLSCIRRTPSSRLPRRSPCRSPTATGTRAPRNAASCLSLRLRPAGCSRPSPGADIRPQLSSRRPRLPRRGLSLRSASRRVPVSHSSQPNRWRRQAHPWSSSHTSCLRRW